MVVDAGELARLVIREIFSDESRIVANVSLFSMDEMPKGII